MYFLGIDYGTKRIGVAVASDPSRIATPLQVMSVSGKTAPTVADDILDIIRACKVNVVVVGESKDFSGADNPVMKKARQFVSILRNTLGDTVQIIFEPEFLTTQQATRLQGDHRHIDASAAALILQSYLDRLGGASREV